MPKCLWMYFTKYPHRANFSFATSFDPATKGFRAGRHELSAELQSFEGGIHRVAVCGRNAWDKNLCLVPLLPPAPVEPNLRVDRGFALEIPDSMGGIALRSVADSAFGVSGESWLFQFAVHPDASFYGMGEKTFGRLELSGVRTKFWNTDVWGDFHIAQWTEHPTDPPYLSVPYLLVKQPSGYVGILLHNPYPSFMETPGSDDERVFVEWQRTAKHAIVGAEGGKPDLWFITGHSMADVTRKLQKLVGLTPKPPLWALGYHQSRWGYGGEEDLVELDKQFTKHGIPCDGLWLDIDYMDGYRVFTTSPELFPNGETAACEKVLPRRVVPILDPGVKRDPGYFAYDEGVSAQHFCLNEEGAPFVGMVWPGETFFPDFTLESVREWWSDHVARFTERGFGGYWLDMNDPSTGPVDPNGMLFDRGRAPHEAHHNQYALGMQMASHVGLRRARPEERPFLLSRSGFTGTSRYSAVWTGDNLSNRFYLQSCIPTTLNLSLSGIPFNGPDVGGFGGDCPEDLMIDWVKACFLFPFMRNHAVKEAARQEPWRYSKQGLSIIGNYLRLRYKLLPYLYQCFLKQADEGDPTLRPMLYDFEDQLFEKTHDQFMVGPSLLAAPFLSEDRRREVLLPQGSWFDCRSGKWLHGGKIQVEARPNETPLFVRSNAVVPMASGNPVTLPDLYDVELHVFASPEAAHVEYVYEADDGISVNPQVRRARLSASISNDAIHLTISTEDGLSVRLFLHGTKERACFVNGEAAKSQATQVTLTGKPLDCLRVWG